MECNLSNLNGNGNVWNRSTTTQISSSKLDNKNTLSSLGSNNYTWIWILDVVNSFVNMIVPKISITSNELKTQTYMTKSSLVFFFALRSFQTHYHPQKKQHLLDIHDYNNLEVESQTKWTFQNIHMAILKKQHGGHKHGQCSSWKKELNPHHNVDKCI